LASDLPRPLERREILYGQATPRERLLELAEAYFAEGRLFDAVDFFAQARGREGLARIKGRALAEGDAFLLRRVQEAMPELVGAADWQLLEASARSAGKLLYAERASRGGTPPPPPLQEEARLGEVQPAAGAAPPQEGPRSGRAGPGARRGKAIQGG